MEVVFHPLVTRDVASISLFYHKISIKLAAEFTSELQHTIEQLSTNPLRFSQIESGLRRANLKRFPCNIVYKLRDDQVRVLIVRHHKRHPEFGLKRQ